MNEIDVSVFITQQIAYYWNYNLTIAGIHVKNIIY